MTYRGVSTSWPPRIEAPFGRPAGPPVEAWPPRIEAPFGRPAGPPVGEAVSIVPPLCAAPATGHREKPPRRRLFTRRTTSFSIERSLDVKGEGETPERYLCARLDPNIS